MRGISAGCPAEAFLQGTCDPRPGYAEPIFDKAGPMAGWPR